MPSPRPFTRRKVGILKQPEADPLAKALLVDLPEPCTGVIDVMIVVKYL